MKIEIKLATNGYIVKYNNDGIINIKVYTEKDENDETNKDHTLNMLNDILEFNGETTDSRYDKRRIFLGYKTGDKSIVLKKKLKKE